MISTKCYRTIGIARNGGDLQSATPQISAVVDVIPAPEEMSGFADFFFWQMWVRTEPRLESEFKEGESDNKWAAAPGCSQLDSLHFRYSPKI